MRAGGDLNGDGFDDLIAADPGHDEPGADSGIVRVDAGVPGTISAVSWTVAAP